MGRAPCCDKANVKKGPWSPEEDVKLRSFIEQNGTGGNWITLPSKAGLKRCGKSCRLRWINYLRPDIKHGSFTEEEEKTIYRLHAQIGSRWSLIAGQLPGRTDNDIKNYWNTRLKKKLLERDSVTGGRPSPQPSHSPADVFNPSGMMQAQVASLPHRQLTCNMNQDTHNNQLAYERQLIPEMSQSMPILQSIDSSSTRSQVGDEVVLALPNAGVDPRLMYIESSFRSLIVPDESSASGSGSDSHRIDPVHYEYSTAASPASSCSNLSSDRKGFGVQTVDSDFTETGDEMYVDLGRSVPAVTMLNTSLLSAQPPVSSFENPNAQNSLPVPLPNSLLPSSRFDDPLLFGEDFTVYNRPPQAFPDSEVMVVNPVKEDVDTPTSASGDWWSTMNFMSPLRSDLNLGFTGGIGLRSGGIQPMMNTKWPVSTPRCGTEIIYTSPQSQLAAQPRGTETLQVDARRGYVADTVLSKLIA
ncbi:hypothetical protein R1sor_005836 [Riccia sorocarpa]|uniref:Uncharacterized protein n=1 Tax=Riccia sorocarpa TaxID=122646 RepID=A0ABD3HPJ2_9MARC